MDIERQASIDPFRVRVRVRIRDESRSEQFFTDKDGSSVDSSILNDRRSIVLTPSFTATVS